MKHNCKWNAVLLMLVQWKAITRFFCQSVKWKLILLTYALMWAFGAFLGMIKQDLTTWNGMLGATYVTTFFVGLTLLKIFIHCVRYVLDHEKTTYRTGAKRN